ncbi:transposase [Leptospira ilyithenensis]|nr:transposase [Leptospira ilyithenensis]
MKTIYIGIDWSRDFINLTALSENESILLIEQINLLDHQIAKMNSDIDSLYNNHSGSRILSSIPAMGTMIGATLLAELSDESRRFRDYRAFQAYAGTSPISRQSGKS